MAAKTPKIRARSGDEMNVTVTLDGETRPVTLTKQGKPIKLQFKRGAVMVDVRCKKRSS